MRKQNFHIYNFGGHLLVPFLMIFLALCCAPNKDQTKGPQGVTAKEILGNPNFQAISYGGYRSTTRDTQPTIKEIKEDLMILSAMGIKLLRTYNVHLDHASNVLKAIQEIKSEQSDFEMYVMLGAWIDCKNAWTDKTPIHQEESERNAIEIDRAIVLANQYPEIVKVIAVGNEAMVKWAAAYYVEPAIILKWVNYLQDQKKQGALDKDLWITSSDNFASWGGGGKEYHVPELDELIKAVDYISMHTYPMHDTHYNPSFWNAKELDHGNQEVIDSAMQRAISYAQSQYEAVAQYLQSIGVDKPIHIGETGWASASDGLYGVEGSKACDEYKQGLYYKHVRDWTRREGITCFFFEAFDEQWKDANNPKGSENHFGLFSLTGQAKYALWEDADQGIFKDLSRGGHPITKTFDGNFGELMLTISPTYSTDND